MVVLEAMRAVHVTCCSFPWPHRHYPAWLWPPFSTVNCNCGAHPRSISVIWLLEDFRRRGKKV